MDMTREDVESIWEAGKRKKELAADWLHYVRNKQYGMAIAARREINRLTIEIREKYEIII